ncbi:hypothetical protein [Streptomyces sp. NPDC012888]|uniref:hypothetical protein n=1 Tax=Streptomyces sp. NPDC012888 TaxID=3364855 RepID=UPI0036A1757D
MAPALLTATVIIAAWIVRTAAGELRRPGSARAEWDALRDPRAVQAGVLTAGLLGLLGWLHARAEGLVWALLTATLVTYAVSRVRSS